jgi:hypothetical protein
LAFAGRAWLRSLWWWTQASVAPKVAGHWTAADLAVAVISLTGLAIVMILIHELGHVLVGMLAGFRISSMRIGPLLFDRTSGISRHRGPGTWTRGEAMMHPMTTSRLIPRGVAMVAAGPAANLLSGFAVLSLPVPLGLYSGLFVVSSIMAGVIELLVPYRSRSLTFDGARIWMLLRDPARGERWLALMQLGAELRDGAQPEALSADFMAKAVAVSDDSPETVAAHAIAYLADFHRHKDAEAAQALETCLKYASAATPALRQALLSDAAIFQARRRNRVDLAAQWLGEMHDVPGLPWLPLRAQAAICEANGDVEEALKKLVEVERMLGAIPNQTQREMSLRFLHRWQRELRAGSTG